MRKLIRLGIVVGVSAGLAVTARLAGAADAVQLFDLADVRLSTYRDTTVINAFGHWLLDTEA